MHTDTETLKFHETVFLSFPNSFYACVGRRVYPLFECVFRGETVVYNSFLFLSEHGETERVQWWVIAGRK